MEEVKVENYKPKKSWKCKHINARRETSRHPTPGLDDVFYKHGAANDASDFKDTKKKLARYAAINYNHGADAAEKHTK